MSSPSPNILFILIDDLGWRDLVCTGSDFYETPHLDQLAARGLRFDNAYAAAPVCSPTRASILSGKYPATVGVTQFIGGHGVGKLLDVPYHHNLPMSEVSLASALREGGYQTWHVGKWHLGGRHTRPEAHGFEINVGGGEFGMPRKGYTSPHHLPNLEEGPEGEYLTDRLTDEAIRLIKDRDPERPFFLNLWHYAVHVPIEAPADLVDKYREKARRLGRDPEADLVEGEYYPVQHKRHERLSRRIRQSDPVYAAMMENLDTNIGRVLAALEESGEAGNTLVIFTSDNGGLSTAEGAPTCNAPLAEGKGWMYEGGNRVPLIIHWPGVTTPGSVCGEPVTSPDFYPTLLAAAGLPGRPEQHVDGVDFSPLLRGDSTFSRGPIFWHYPHYSNQGDTPGSAVVDGDWKLIEYFEDERLELYNLADDVSETHDKSGIEPAIRDRLHGQLKEWRDSVEALIPKPNPNWKPTYE
jgi:arylsulfatase A-like enzyme